MQGQMTEENIYQLERLFENRDSIKIVRKQVERYERLIMEQAEKIERARRNVDEAERLRMEAESLKEKE
jgi:phosphoenolpyruvate synthase/pyruvate phosphate dikinase